MKGILAACLSALFVTSLASAYVVDLDDTKNTTTGNYTISEGGKPPCFILTATVTYNVSMHGQKERWTGFLYDDGATNVTGYCSRAGSGGTVSQMIITNPDVERPISVEMNFFQNTTSKAWNGLSFTVTFPGATDTFTSDVQATDLVATGNAGGLAADSDAGLSCSSANVTINGTTIGGVLSFTDFKLYPGFVDTSKSLDICKIDQKPATSNVVPIAVGCALAGLVLIVLVAYLIGRTRHERQHKGYQSV